MISKNVYEYPPDEQGRRRLENRTYRSIYTDVTEPGERPVHTKELNGIEGTWASIAPKQITVLSKNTFFWLQTGREREEDEANGKI